MIVETEAPSTGCYDQARSAFKKQTGATSNMPADPEPDVA